MLTNHRAGGCAIYLMYSNMRLDYAGKKEYRYRSRFNIRYDSGDLFIIPRLSREISPTILGYLKSYVCGIVCSRSLGTNTLIIYLFYTRLSCLFTSSLQQLYQQHHPSRVRPVNIETFDVAITPPQVISEVP